jgi:hypothetical protein
MSIDNAIFTVPVRSQPEARLAKLRAPAGEQYTYCDDVHNPILLQFVYCICFLQLTPKIWRKYVNQGHNISNFSWRSRFCLFGVKPRDVWRDMSRAKG